MKTSSSCPKCGAQRQSSTRGEYCPACYLSVGLEGIEIPSEESLDQIAEKPGDTIGRFELLEQIGEGGFGVVFRALQREPVRRILALKVIKPGMDSREVVSRFEAERQALALMDHPHIAKVYDAGTTALGRPFFVMELVEGLPLTTFCDENELTIEQRLELFARICGGVQHAHQKGVIHRDLKPSNVLVHLDDNGEACPKIIDFGVAKAIGIELTEQTFFTLFGRLVGTPEYMSPEQAGLNALDVDTRSDIYSLGVLLHELLTGCVPLSRELLTKNGFDDMRRLIREQEPLKPSSHFASLDAKKRERIASSRHTEASRLDRQLRGDLDWIVLRSIEKDRTRRYDTAQGFAIDVGRFMEGLPVNASPPSTMYRVGKFARRNRVGVMVATLSLLALIIGTVASTLAYKFQKKTSDDNERLKLIAIREAEENQRLKDMSDQEAQAALKAYRKGLIITATNKREAQGEGWLKSALDNIREAAGIEIAEDLRNEALACLAGSDMEKISLDLVLNDPLIPAAFSPDHQLLAIAWNNKGIEIRRKNQSGIFAPSDNDPITTDLTGPTLRSGRMSFAGEGNRYLIIVPDLKENPKIEVVDLETLQVCFESPEISNQAFDLLPGHQGLVIAGPESVTFVDWNGQPLKPPLPVPDPPIAVALSPNGQSLAVGFESPPPHNVLDGRLTIYPCSPEPKDPWVRRGFEPWTLSWSPSGKYLAMADANKALTVFEPGKHNTDHILSGHSEEITQITWSPDEQLLASAHSNWDIRLWDARHWQALSTHQARAGTFSFSPDGSQLGPVIWEEKLFTLGISRTKVCHHAVGHGGKDHIVASAWDSRVSEDKADDREQHYSLTFATAGNDSVILWNRSGKALARLHDVKRPCGLAFSKSWFYIAGENGIKRRKMSVVDINPNPLAGEGLFACKLILSAPQTFGDFDHCRKIAVTPDDKLLVAASDAGVWLIPTDGNGPRLLQNSAVELNFDIDDNGRWLAVGGNPSNNDSAQKVQIYGLPDGKLIKELPATGSAVAFSSVLDEEGRILLATGDSSKYQFWSANDDWKELPELEIENRMADLPGRMVFSPRSTALAVSYNRDKLKVLNPRTSPMEVLTRPGFDSQWPLAISSDGALIGTEGHDGRLFIWDLMAVRREFQQLGIDWDMEDFKKPHDMRILVAVQIAGQSSSQRENSDSK